MSDFETAARPYAKALFELASENDQLEDWNDRLQVAGVIASDAEMNSVIESPSMLASQQAELFISVYSAVNNAPVANDEFKNLISLLAENGRLASLPSISVILESLKRESEGKVEVQVTSALELSDKQQQDIANSLVKKLGKEVSITTAVDESLIAGAIIQAGDMVIDGSARGRLDKLTIALDE
ncbi:MAG: F0F1 ATP synthase subunit delta [Gammaproteobacteria bacterium]|nr:F0F1 ATP synthase subunit delta [Gammaproteobacteria bacterium]